jgi:hypothetical protein
VALFPVAELWYYYLTVERRTESNLGVLFKGTNPIVEAPSS